MAAPCYCCPMMKGKKGSPLEKQSSRAELDNALNELGMLSSVTDSRRDYLREKMKDVVPSSPELCVLQMNSDFVTNFSFSKGNAAVPNSSGASPDVDESSTFLSEHFNNLKSRKMKYSKNRNLYRPYDFPCRSKYHQRTVKKVRAFSLGSVPQNNSAASFFFNGAASAVGGGIINHQDGGNKSNPGSPVKSQKKSTNKGCSITRSRSLDDLEISKLNLTDCCGNEAGRAEIEIVSQRINNLHVS